VIACCALHNFICINNGAEQWLEQVDSNIDPTNIIDIPSGDVHHRSDAQYLNERGALSNAKRDKFAEAMWKDYTEYLLRNSRSGAWYRFVFYIFCNSMSTEMNDVF
jgi:hypothetical protein